MTSGIGFNCVSGVGVSREFSYLPYTSRPCAGSLGCLRFVGAPLSVRRSRGARDLLPRSSFSLAALAAATACHCQRALARLPRKSSAARRRLVEYAHTCSPLRGLPSTDALQSLRPLP